MHFGNLVTEWHRRSWCVLSGKHLVAPRLDIHGYGSMEIKNSPRMPNNLGRCLTMLYITLRHSFIPWGCSFIYSIGMFIRLICMLFRCFWSLCSCFRMTLSLCLSHSLPVPLTLGARA